MTDISTTTAWKVDALNDEHDCSAIQSSRPEIDSWFHDHAARLQREGLARTYVWADQYPWVGGFFTLRPERYVDLDTTEGLRVPGHTGGPISGYLLAKVAVDHRIARAVSTVAVGASGETISLSNTHLLLAAAVARARVAAEIGGGAYLFVNTDKEPEWISSALADIGFTPVRPGGDATHFLYVGGVLVSSSD